MDTPLYFATQAGFLALTVICMVLFVREIWRGIEATDWKPDRKRSYRMSLVILILIWGLFIAAWSLSGVMADFSLFPLNVLPVIIIPLLTAILWIPSRAMGEVLDRISADRIIRLQSFRFFVEILLWMLFLAALLPVQMTFEGRNFDILAGITAPLIAGLTLRNRISATALITWNVVSLALLINIVTIAILSMPSPWRVFTNEPGNFIVTKFPFCWLPGLLVPLAYYLHFISLRQVVRRIPVAQAKT